MTTTAHEDQYTAAPEPVRQPYDTVAILRRNVADLELALRTQTERAEAAEADIERYVGINAELATEMTKVREQKPVAWMIECQQWTGDTAWQLSWSQSGAGQCNRLEGDSHQRPLYAAPVPAPAVPSVVFMAHNKTSSILFAARKDADQYAASFGPAAGVSVTECAVIGSQSAPQAPAVPELDPMTRLIVSDPKQLKLKKQEPAVPEWPAMLRTRRFIRREAWNPEAFIWFKPGDDRNHSTVMLYTHGKVHAGWIGVHCDHHARDWVYCDDMARALLQSEVTK